MASPCQQHDGKVVYFADMTRHVYALDAETGKQIWILEVRGEGGISSSPKISSDGILYIAVESGRFIALNTSLNNKMEPYTSMKLLNLT